MPKRIQVFAFLLFFTSGFCSLAYQLIWMRLAMADFGVLSSVLSVVVAVFMAGLFAGTLLAGKILETSYWARRRPLRLYALSEALCGLGAILVPHLFHAAEILLLPADASNSFPYLFRSALGIAISILPWCIAMGASLPFMMAHLRSDAIFHGKSFSYLYLANLLGALAGVAATSIFLIEAFGFKCSLELAASLNLSLALLGFLWSLQASENTTSHGVSLDREEMSVAKLPEPQFLLLVLALCGFSSMGMEIVWSRAFVPIMGNQVYAFAAILFSYLLATALGSSSYRFLGARGRSPSIFSLLGLLALLSLAPIVMNDPRHSHNPIIAPLSISPFCFFLGFLTPQIIDHYSLGDPSRAARAYAYNVLGSFLGPLLASYILLPYVGIKLSILLLCLPFLALLTAGWSRTSRLERALVLSALLALPIVQVHYMTTEDPPAAGVSQWELRRDATATVLSFYDGKHKRLMVNGINITNQTSVTKYMAHFPLAELPYPPRQALDICFGMGTTFRSLSSWGISCTAVELVPSVKESFPFYFADAQQILDEPRNSVVVDDGRRFLKRCGKSYDLITLDPPPPFEAAASSLLYSEEFYSLVKAHLNPGGILAQWLPFAPNWSPQEELAAGAAAKALQNSFPYVRVFVSVEGWGLHLLASESPIAPKSAEELSRSLPLAAQKDLLEWNPSLKVQDAFAKLLKGEFPIESMSAGIREGLKDDRPFNEYYLCRNFWPNWPQVSDR